MRDIACLSFIGIGDFTYLHARQAELIEDF